MTETPKTSDTREAQASRTGEPAEAYFTRTVEQSVVAAVLRAAGPTRRQFLAGLGRTVLTALISEVLPMPRMIAFAADPAGKPEKKDLSIGFIPITCATPIIMAEPMGFYKGSSGNCVGN
ncbi:ABC transporter substrate-binding protein [Nitrospira sp. Kam-Ns4a]